MLADIVAHMYVPDSCGLSELLTEMYSPAKLSALLQGTVG